MHFRIGVDFYRERNYRAALIEFKRAYKASPHFKLLYNLGQASLELQEDAAAITYFSNYLHEAGEELAPERRKEVEQDIARLQARLAHLTITVNEPGAELYVDDSLVGTSPLGAPVKLSVGRRKIMAKKDGFSDAERTLDVASGDNLTVVLELKDDSQDLPNLSIANTPPQKEESVLSAAAWSGIATGVVGAGAITMSVLTAVAQSNYDEENKQQTSVAKIQAIRDDAKLKALLADIAWGATIVGAGLTTVLLILDHGAEEAPSDKTSKIKVELGAGSLYMRGAF
jgi:hypothetical protein